MDWKLLALIYLIYLADGLPRLFPAPHPGTFCSPFRMALVGLNVVEVLNYLPQDFFQTLHWVDYGSLRDLHLDRSQGSSWPTTVLVLSELTVLRLHPPMSYAAANALLL